MKRLFSLFLSLILVLGLVSCASSSASKISSEEKAITDAASAEALETLARQYGDEGKYEYAMQAAKKLLELDPDSQDGYLLKAELRIREMQSAYGELNAMVEEDLGSVPDPAAYKEELARMYEEAGLDLIIPFVPDYASPEEINTVGNSAQNLYGIVWNADGSSVSGVFASQGEWIYYADPKDHYALYKGRTDGGSLEKITSDAACSLNVAGDWIYYINRGEENSLYKIRTDGSGRTRLTDDACASAVVCGDWIYYVNQDDRDTIYRIGIDGAAREIFGKTDAKLLFTDGVWLYFSSEDEENLVRLKLDKSGQEYLLGRWHVWVYLYEGWLYYLTDDNGLAILKMRPDGADVTEVWHYDAKINFYALLDGRLIVSVRDREGKEGLLALRLDTLEEELSLENVHSEAVCSDSRGNVYFITSADDLGLYRIDWETGSAVPIG
ncbi:DUF5050 domain-containing protein [Papillibacter cinnamivorans]|uniref:Prolow-density lipoprotein receptor-related protein 1-like beta-propeller domain-containing protein n=1 Tax=Papillibacter cinnamivorans DSM 12816 TaxID=1122930 RepID=A0A1W2B0J5_9FIRM|nr:DUF5050 domain-containing protein [Papillibacter cinnamivorans]SMC66394.1 protein of unknown function [Papillibacter cinnamivorans DSM 12816]